MVKLLFFVGCLTSQQHENVSQGQICTDNFTCCHTEIEAADPTFHLTHSTPKKSRRKRDLNPGPSALEADALLLGQRGGVVVKIGTRGGRWEVQRRADVRVL